MKKLLKFDVLDESKSAKKSNKARNPNAQIVNECLPNPFGQVFVVNAEKVILNKVDLSDQLVLIENDEDEEDKKAKAQAVAARPQVIRETKTVYVNNTPRSSSSSSGSNSETYAGTSQGTTQKQGMSKAAKGTIIGTVGGAAAGAIINKKNRAAGAVVGGIIGGATGYTIGRAGDRKDGRVQPR